MRGGTDRSAYKGDNKDDADLWDEHDFDVEGKKGAERETKKGTGTTTKRARIRRRKKKRGWGGEDAAAKNEKEDEAKKEENLSSHAKRIKRLNMQTEQIDKEMLSKKPCYIRVEAGGEYLPSDSLLQSTPEF